MFSKQRNCLNQMHKLVQGTEPGQSHKEMLIILRSIKLLQNEEFESTVDAYSIAKLSVTALRTVSYKINKLERKENDLFAQPLQGNY